MKMSAAIFGRGVTVCVSLRVSFVSGSICLAGLACVPAWAGGEIGIPFRQGTNSNDITASILAGLDRKGPLEKLDEMESNATADDLRAALTNSDVLVRERAATAVGNRADETLIPDLMRALGDERGSVRVEAALALELHSNPAARTALIEEMVKARQVEMKLSSGEMRRTVWVNWDMHAWIKAAGKLADMGNSNGYDFVRATFVDARLESFRDLAVIQMPEFMQFGNNNVDVRNLLLAATDDAISKIDQKLVQDPNRSPMAELANFDVIARILSAVGDERAIAKLKQCAQHKDPRVRFSAQTYLRLIEDRLHVHGEADGQKAADPKKWPSV